MAALTQIKSLVRKDLVQLLHNKSYVNGILFFTIFLNLLYPSLLTFQVRDIAVSVVDHDQSALSSRIVRDLRQVEQFSFDGLYATHEDAFSAMYEGHVDCILEIPSGFESGLVRKVIGQAASLPRMHISTNSINTTKAIPATQYVKGCVAQTIRNYAQDKGLTISQASDDITVTNAYNPFNDYKRVMLPIIILNILLCFNTPARLMSNEHEYGTIDQINVSPMSTLSLMASKVITSLVTGLVVICLSMVSLWLVYGFMPEGSILLMLLAIALFIIGASGMTLILCNCMREGSKMILYSSILSLFAQIASGYYTPLECMAEWILWASHLFPTRYVITILRNVSLKGAGLADLGPEFLYLTGLSLLYFFISVLTYRKSHS